MHRIYSNVNNQESDPQQQQPGINEGSAGINEPSGDVSSIKLGAAKENMKKKAKKGAGGDGQSLGRKKALAVLFDLLIA